jgi:hypothetical protein
MKREEGKKENEKQLTKRGKRWRDGEVGRKE